MKGPVQFISDQRKARAFTKSMRDVIHSLHPDARFRIRHKMLPNDKVELSIDTNDDRAAACFILIQEAWKSDTGNENETGSEQGVS